MHFDTLKDKCEYFRSLTDYKLTPNSYVIAMLDGRSFSKLIKNNFEKPFDKDFVEMMNNTAKFLCENVQGCKFAYTQSDEISLLITDFDTPDTDAAFGYRICKLQSILASLATSEFNRHLIKYQLEQTNTGDDYRFENVIDKINKVKLAQFDCKVWTVPDYNTAFCHFLWRQNDCIRNSKQQTAQTYLSHKELMGKQTDEQIEMLKAEKGIDWNTFEPGLKYGRLIYKERRLFKHLVMDTETAGLDGVSMTGLTEQEYIRSVWSVFPATPFGVDENNVIRTLIPKRA